MSSNKITPPNGLKTIYLDVMEKGRFICQVAYKYYPLFPLDLQKLSDYVKRQRPSLRNRNINIALSSNRV